MDLKKKYTEETGGKPYCLTKSGMYVKSGSYSDGYVKWLEKQLLIHSVVGQSEQLTCPRCKSTNILNPDKDNDAQCIECAFMWAG
jgi:transposase-like protein